MNERLFPEIIHVLGVNGGVLGIVSLAEVESIMSIALLALTCIWTAIKIYKLISK